MGMFSSSSQMLDAVGALHLLSVSILGVTLITGFIMLFFISRPRWRYISVFTSLAALSYIGTVGLGLIAVKNYDNQVQSITNVIFSIKEHLAVVGFFIAIVVAILSIFGRLKRTSRWRRQFFASLYMVLTLISLAQIVLMLFFKDLQG